LAGSQTAKPPDPLINGSRVWSLPIGAMGTVSSAFSAHIPCELSYLTPLLARTAVHPILATRCSCWAKLRLCSLVATAIQTILASVRPQSGVEMANTEWGKGTGEA
jgi:hypothetical protein